MDAGLQGFVDAPFERRSTIARLAALCERYERMVDWYDPDASVRRRAGRDLLLRHPTGLREALEIDAAEAEARRAAARLELERVRAAAPLPPAEPERRRLHALADLEAWMLDLRRARRARRGGPPADVHPALDALTARPVSERLITLLAWLETRHDAPEWWRWVWGPRGEELDVGASEDFPLGELRSVQGDDARLLIVRLPDGLRAAAADCPHRGGDLAAGDLEAGALVCPVHAWAFSLDDGSCAADRSCRLPLYGVREVGGRVRVRTDAR